MGSSGGLKQDLDSYLSRNSTSGGISLPKTSLGKWFRKTEQEDEDKEIGPRSVMQIKTGSLQLWHLDVTASKLCVQSLLAIIKLTSEETH